MILIVALDDKNGMTFNKRRQSQDSVLRERIGQRTKGHKLWMNAYSRKQFSGIDISNLQVSEDFLKEAESGDYCFVENVPVSAYAEWVEKIIVYKWNRSYPTDMAFDLLLDGWRLVQSMDFKGSSHDRITEEVYEK